MLEPTGPNAEQIRYWNETAGPKWVALQHLLDGQLATLGRRTMDRAQLADGDRVLDVGCGCGSTSIELARRVAPRGRVTGIDVSAVMLVQARQEAAAANVASVHFENADAQVHSFAPAEFDVLYSRFGVMFFADPRAAFTNLRAALAPGGRLAFICWRPLQENPWMFVPLMAVAQRVTLPPLPAPGSPGPFAFDDAGRVRSILSDSGFGDISFEEVDEPLIIGGGADIDRVADFMLQMGPAAAVLRESGLAPDTREIAMAALCAALAPYRTPQGVRMESAAWIVTAAAR